MTELETKLSDALDALGRQYQLAMTQLGQQNALLSSQVANLTDQVQTFGARFAELEKQLDALTNTLAELSRT